MKKTVLPFFVALFCEAASLTAGPLSDAEKRERDMMIRLEWQLNSTRRYAEESMNAALTQVYMLAYRDSSFKPAYDSLLAITKTVQKFHSDAFWLVASLHIAGEKIDHPVADTIRMSALKNPFVCDDLKPVLFGTSPSDTSKSGVMQLYQNIEAVEASFGSMKYAYDFRLQMRAELNTTAMAWGHSVFDKQPLIADIIVIRALEAKLYAAVAACFQHYSVEKVAKKIY